MPSKTEKATKAKESTTRPRKNPPRPPNCYIIYRSEMNAAFKKNQSKVHQKDISRIVSRMWHAMSPEIRALYDSKAEEAKKEHARKYPDYKFQPVQKTDGPKKRGGAKATKAKARVAMKSGALPEAALPAAASSEAQHAYPASVGGSLDDSDVDSSLGISSGAASPGSSLVDDLSHTDATQPGAAPWGYFDANAAQAVGADAMPPHLAMAATTTYASDQGGVPYDANAPINSGPQYVPVMNSEFVAMETLQAPLSAPPQDYGMHASVHYGATVAYMALPELPERSNAGGMGPPWTCGPSASTSGFPAVNGMRGPSWVDGPLGAHLIDHAGPSAAVSQGYETFPGVLAGNMERMSLPHIPSDPFGKLGMPASSAPASFLPYQAGAATPHAVQEGWWSSDGSFTSRARHMHP